MSKKRHRDRMNYNYMNSDPRYQMRNNMYNNPFGINPQQLLNMLGGNLDLNSLNNLITSMNKDGFDFNSMNQRMNNHNMNNNANQNMNNNAKQNMEEKQEQKVEDNVNLEQDENIIMLLSLKNIVDPKRVEFIDKIITAYKNGNINY